MKNELKLNRVLLTLHLSTQILYPYLSTMIAMP